MPAFRRSSGAASVVDATDTTKGIVELATTIEASAGTDTARAVTPAGVASAIISTVGTPTQIESWQTITSDGFGGAAGSLNGRAFDLAAGGTAKTWTETVPGGFVTDGTGKVIIGTNTAADFAYYPETVEDVRVSLTINDDTGVPFYIYARRTALDGALDAITAWFTGYSVRLLQTNNGANAALGTSQDFNPGDKVTVEATGATIRLYINDALRETATTTATGTGLVGFQVSSGAGSLIIDDFLVEKRVLTSGIAYTAPNASTFGRGIVELATTAEAAALLDTVRAVTPAGVDAALKSLTTAEIVRDIIGATLSQGTGITITPDDTEDQIVISSTATGGDTALDWGKWSGTQAQYDALGAWNNDTLYAIVGGVTPPAGATWGITDAFAATESPPATADTGQAWRVESGTWNQSAGAVSATADGAILVIDTGSTTHTVEAVIGGTISSANSFPTFIVGYDNTNDHHYRIGKANSGELRVQRYDPSATVTWQHPVAGMTTAGTRIRVSLSGSGATKAIRIWVDGVEQTTKTTGTATYTANVGWIDGDSTPPNGTEVGFRYGSVSTGNTYNFQEFKADAAVVVP